METAGEKFTLGPRAYMRNVASLSQISEHCVARVAHSTERQELACKGALSTPDRECEKNVLEDDADIKQAVTGSLGRRKGSRMTVCDWVIRLK
jgi:hypothetical protein